MRSFYKNEKGLSLVELLAALAIASIITLFITTVHIFIQNQYNSQSTDVKELTDITVAMRAITKDIRSADEIVPEHADDINHIELKGDDNPESIKYSFEAGILKKNGSPYIYELEEFKVEIIDSKVSLVIKSKSGKEVKTEIVIRKEGESNGQ